MQYRLTRYPVTPQLQRRMCRSIIVGVMMMPLALAAQDPNFQLTMPSIKVAVDASDRVPSAAEAAYRVSLKQTQADLAISFRDVHYPKDSLLNVVKASAAVWWNELQKRPIKGLQCDPSGLVSVAAGHEATAQAQIRERLADQTLTQAERAYTYLIAVHGFASPYYPERLSIAEGYLKELDALGTDAALWQYVARTTLIDAYYALGRTADVARHGVAAMLLLPKMVYVDIDPLDVWLKRYMIVMQALSGSPQGQARIDTVIRALRQTIAPPPDMLALDPLDLERERQFRQAFFDHFIPVGRMLGTVRGPITGNYWINRPTTDSASISVTTGKITLFEPFSYGCSGCLAELVMLQRLKERYPGIQVVGATFTLGHWGNRLVEPREEATHIADHFTNKLRLTIPIAIVFGKKTSNEDGGISLTEGAWYGPNYDRYPFIVKSPVWVMDPRGRVRQVILGPGDERETRENEEILARTIEFLQKEEAQSPVQGRVSQALVQ